MWGHRFTNIVEYDRQNGVYEADYDQFDSTEPVRKSIPKIMSVVLIGSLFGSGRYTAVQCKTSRRSDRRTSENFQWIFGKRS